MKKVPIAVIALTLLLWACKKTPVEQFENLEHIAYNPTAYTPDTIYKGYKPMEIPTDNPMTEQGIELGRYLFYDPILSRDSTISCSSCHDIKKAFTDGSAVSTGIDGRLGTRSSMSLINIGYSWNKDRDFNFFWDGRAATLEDQALIPVEDPNEMGENWNNVESKLRHHQVYKRMFREAFGITHTGEITKYLAAKALAQFERTLNSAQSAFDHDRWVPFVYMTQLEQDGFELFIGDAGGGNLKDAECGHCHSSSSEYTYFTNNAFFNNGIDKVQYYNDFVDNGLGAINKDSLQNGLFRTVSLRNIGLTAPYMHDGRFATLREVIDHYSTLGVNGHKLPNIAPDLTGATDLETLTNYEKDALVAFLHTLTDSSYFYKTEWMSPF